MSWRDRPYAREDEYGGGRGGGMGFRLPPMTPVIKWLMIVNVAVAALGIFWAGPRHAVGGMHPFEYYGSLMPWTRTIQHGQFWRLLTYQYLHDTQSPAHLLFNMLALWFLGPPVERTMGGRRFFWFYTTCGVVAGLAFLGIEPLVTAHQDIPRLIGASGSVLGVIAALAMFFPRQTVLLMLVVPMKIRTLAIGIAAVYLVSVIGHKNLSDVAHLGGMLGGAVWVLAERRLGVRGRGAGGASTESSPRERVGRSAGAWAKHQAKMRKLEAQVDQVLAKVHERGIGSLTRREKRLLKKATELQQEEARQREERLRDWGVH
ncbi:MAG: hypothetical protein BIFFINMI_03209 [Phycisphaerae bacterium]|nr:hypothetical protein [Phycisphaerae bacterium]